ncbi:MAG: hypothetical protein ACKO3N_17040 [Verrucomicrobiota bacterium]
MTRRYEIYENESGRHLAVPLGFSLGAALLDWVWALGLRLWGAAIVLFILNGLLAGILYANRSSWQAYALIQVLQGLGVGFAARRLREMSAERRGYAYRCTIPARNGAGAIAKLGQLGGVPLEEWRPRHLVGVPDLAPREFRGLLAVALLTLKAAFRYRLVVALLGVLVLAVFALPLAIKHDGTATGFTQILLTYTLSAITALLGFATLWLACGTLARDIDDFAMTLVAVKPVPRWQIWLGKWSGIMLLNAGLVALAGAVVYGLLQIRAGQLPPAQRAKLQNEVLVARAAARVPIPNLEPEVERLFAERRRESSVSEMDPAFVRSQIRESLKARLQAVGPGQLRAVPWVFDLGPEAVQRLKDRPLYLRVRFFTPEYASPESVFNHGWEIGDPAVSAPLRFRNSFGPETPTEFEISSSQLTPDGRLAVRYANLNDKTVLFPLEDGIEVLYHEGGFLLNYSRGLGIIVCWLGLLTAVGLFSASFLSFPVASFVSLALLVIGLSSGTLKQVVEQGGLLGLDNETGQVREFSLVNRAAVAVYGSAHWTLQQVGGFSPVGHLSTGRSIIDHVNVCIQDAMIEKKIILSDG